MDALDVLQDTQKRAGGFQSEVADILHQFDCKKCGKPTCGVILGGMSRAEAGWCTCAKDGA